MRNLSQEMIEMMNTKLMNAKLLSLLFALPVLVTTGSNTFARDGMLKSADPGLFLGQQSNSAVTQEESRSQELLVAARGEQPGKCELLGICK
ncbi:hypothetical protein [Laspinema olomoucense]|uniref:hypothetical protein n=1 Tax=Laspinema olomoucense TaxID=3231600 RepID=UPI0021BA50A4|nr:hypothetical protein [Laspinema sp. D3c]MCT7994893.1 hypothetical protein [Laspinema sp. D3c]